MILHNFIARPLIVSSTSIRCLLYHPCCYALHHHHHIPRSLTRRWYLGSTSISVIIFYFFFLFYCSEHSMELKYSVRTLRTMSTPTPSLCPLVLLLDTGSSLTRMFNHQNHHHQHSTFTITTFSHPFHLYSWCSWLCVPHYVSNLVLASAIPPLNSIVCRPVRVKNEERLNGEISSCLPSII